MADIEYEKSLRAEMTDEEWEFYLKLKKDAKELREAIDKEVEAYFQTEEWQETKKRICENLKKYEKRLDRKIAKKKNM